MSGVNYEYGYDDGRGSAPVGGGYGRGPRAQRYMVDNQPRYEEDSSHQEKDKKKNKNLKRAKKAAKKLKVPDFDSGKEAEAEVTIEAPPDGGVSAWAVCGGSAVLSAANAVVRTSLYESIDSINADFNETAAPTASTNYTNCYNALKNNQNSIFEGDAQARGCIDEGIPTFFNCILTAFRSRFVELPAGPAKDCLDLGVPAYYPCLYPLSLKGQAGHDLFYTSCSYLMGGNSSAGTAQRLTAGNLFSASVNSDQDEVGTTMNYIFVYVSLFCILLGAILCVFAGYRIVSIIGSLLVAVGFIVASFLDTDDEVVVQILVGGVGGIGSAFLRVAAVVAVLEYFEDLRMRAIVLSGLGAVLINFLTIGLTFVDSIDFYWRDTFKFQAIPAGISLVASLFMKPLKMKKSSRRQGDSGGVSCSQKCSEYIVSRDLFSDAVLYLVMAVFFLDQLGRPIFSDGMQPILKEKAFTTTQVDIQPLLENGGSLLGLLVLLFWRRHNLADNLAVMAAMDIIIGLLALHVPEMTQYAWAVTYSVLYGFTDGVFVSVIQDAIPEGFSRRHIRIVAGILGFVAGAGTVASGWIGDSIDKNADASSVSYYFSGGCLIGAGVLAIASRFVVVRRQTRDDDGSEDGADAGIHDMRI